MLNEGSTWHHQRGERKSYTVAVQAIQGQNGQLPRNIVLINTLAEVQSGLLPIRVVNLGDEDVWLEPKSRLETTYIVNVVQKSSSVYCKIYKTGNMSSFGKDGSGIVM